MNTKISRSYLQYDYENIWERQYMTVFLAWRMVYIWLFARLEGGRSGRWVKGGWPPGSCPHRSPAAVPAGGCLRASRPAAAATAPNAPAPRPPPPPPLSGPPTSTRTGRACLGTGSWGWGGAASAWGTRRARETADAAGGSSAACAAGWGWRHPAAQRTRRRRSTSAGTRAAVLPPSGSLRTNVQCHYTDTI